MLAFKTKENHNIGIETEWKFYEESHYITRWMWFSIGIFIEKYIYI